MRLAAVVAVAGLVPGCFYTEPLNQRPSARIDGQPSAVVYRGDHVDLSAESNDPDNDPLAYKWRAYACTDAQLGVGAAGGCDQVPYLQGLLKTFSFDVPRLRATGDPAQSVLVDLEVSDTHEATAKPIQQLIIPLGDRGPTVVASKAFHRAYVVDQPVNIFAAVGDPDDGIMPPPALAWTVFSPASQPAFTLTDIANVPADPMHPELAQFGKVLVPHGAGSWDVQIVATDPLGMTAMTDVPIDVFADRPPCLEQVAPIVPPTGQTYPLDQATQFQALVVDDDLDVYPASGDPITGLTTFSWTILPPGGTTRVPVSTTNHVLVDPASYAPGDIVEVRVEVNDRNNRSLAGCAANAPTCSLTGDACIQRQTWRVEVR
ncbi:MAG: hypothetical protein JO257_24780 [Deltaproteobacteria bacterium]|nr:hypothetical protein [Deltaproteobacteria bacterium]